MSNKQIAGASHLALVVKNPSANEGEANSVPGLGRCPGGGNGNPLQYSCLENPMDRGALHTTVHGVAKSQTRLKQLSTHACSQANRWQHIRYLFGTIKCPVLHQAFI